MCGICGLISRTPLTTEDSAAVERVSAALIHRGPDGAGEHRSVQVHLAMRRLAIIDLTGGWQPLWNEDRTIALVANGEVYNHIELRAELESRGHRFRTGSDCETIVHGYEEWGMDFLQKLRGMYALAIHDMRTQRVVLARDRMGEKPLYLHETDGRVLFASELRATMASGLIPFKLNPEAINQYFHYLYVPEPGTPIVGVRKVPAGHFLSIDLRTWEKTERCYWRLEDAPPIDADPVTTIREELDRIAEIITRADVPVGVALSAGIDSSAVAALASRARPGQVHALTVGYPGHPRQDERTAARRWAKELGMPFHEVEVPVREVVELFPERAFWRDDPIADTAGHSYFAVSRLARESGIPVLLKGQGGDELFWGYEWVRRAVAMTRAKAAGRLDSLGEQLGRLWDRMPHGAGPSALRACVLRNIGFVYGYERTNPDAGQPPSRIVGYNASMEYMRGEYALPRILTPDYLAQCRGFDPGVAFDVGGKWDDPGVMLTCMSCRLYLMENGMTQGDRLSMTNSVELRLPLSDYRLAEVAVGLRKVRPDDHLPAKSRFKDAVRPLLPDYILNRPKTGFTPPQRLWMGALVDAYRHSLEGGYLVGNGILSGEGVARLQDRHPRFSPWSDIFYRALVLEFWCRGMEAQVGVHRGRVQRVPTAA